MGGPYRRRRWSLGQMASFVVIAVLVVVATGVVVAFLEMNAT